MTTIPNLTNAAALTGAEYIPTAIAGQVAKRATAFNVGSLGPYTINAKTYCAGDNSTDDTAGMQAAINAALAVGGSLFIPHGIYKLTSELTIGTTTVATSGDFQMIGECRDITGAGGVLLYMYGTGIRSIIAVQRGAWRGVNFRDFSIAANTQDGATYGILSPSAETSNIICEKIVVVGVSDAAFATLADTGSNGEFFVCRDCYAQSVGAFFKNTCGQGFFACLDRCDADLKIGGCFLNMALTTEGGGVLGLDCTWSCSAAGFPNTTMIRSTGANSHGIIFIGGRGEQLTQLYDGPTSSNTIVCPIHIDGMYLNINNDVTNVSNTLKAFISSDAHQDRIHISNCRLQGSNPGDVPSDNIEINAVNNGSYFWQGHVHWENCTFFGLRWPLWHAQANEYFTDCLWLNTSDIGTNNFIRVDNYNPNEWPVWKGIKLFAPSHHWSQYPEWSAVDTLTAFTMDDTIETGQYGSWASSGRVAVRRVSGRDIMVGRDIPAASCTVKVKIKAAASCTQGHYFFDITSSAAIGSSAALALTSSWQILSYSVNFSGLSGHTVQYTTVASSSARAIDMGWFTVESP